MTHGAKLLSEWKAKLDSAFDKMMFHKALLQLQPQGLMMLPHVNSSLHRNYFARILINFMYKCHFFDTWLGIQVMKLIRFPMYIQALDGLSCNGLGDYKNGHFMSLSFRLRTTILEHRVLLIHVYLRKIYIFSSLLAVKCRGIKHYHWYWHITISCHY